jgi:hypothetical protein
MKQIRLSVIILFFTCSLFSQTNQTKISGGYISYQEFKTGKPTFPDDFNIILKSASKILSWDCNDYKIKSSNPEITKKIIRKNIWGIFHNDTLYLNTRLLLKTNYYVNVDSSYGKYSFIFPPLPQNTKVLKELGIDPDYAGYTIAGFLGGAVGGAIYGGIKATQDKKKRIPLVYNMEAGWIKLLSRPTIAGLCNKYPDLRQEFMEEQYKDDPKTLLRYLYLINSRDTN